MKSVPSETETPFTADRYNSMTAADQMKHRHFGDRDLWIAVRAALLAIVDAIERRWDLKPRKER